MNYIIPYTLVFVAAIMNAVMDRVENLPAFNRSIFSHLDKRWWCKEVSWQYVKFIPVMRYRPDAWHLAKSVMLFLLTGLIFADLEWWHYFTMGGVWIVTFSFFYHKALHR